MKEWLYVCSLLSFWGLSLTDRVPTSGASIPLPPKTTNITTHFNSCFLGKKANWSPHNKSRLEYFLSIYLCIWLHQGLECSRQDLVACWIFHCGAQALELMGLEVEVHGLCCPVACGILVPWSGIKLVFPTLEGRFLTTEPPRKSLECYLIFGVLSIFSMWPGDSLLFGHVSESVKTVFILHPAVLVALREEVSPSNLPYFS